MHLNPLTKPVEALYDKTLRNKFLPGVQFTEPAGDPGWFGPGSAVWYVHEHTSNVMIALLASGAMESLHPSVAYAGVDHSKIYERVNGVATGGMVSEKMLQRLSESWSAFEAMAFGSTEVADRAARMVANMHHKVKGNRPDGHAYDADNAELFRWNYATVVWGFARAHELYHPKPLQGSDLDAYFAEYVKVGEALGGTDLPATRKENDECLLAGVRDLAMTPAGMNFYNLIDPSQNKRAVRPALSLLNWMIYDMFPDWARELCLAPGRSGAAGTAVRRRIVRGLFNTIHESSDKVEPRQAIARAAAKAVVAA